MPSSIFESFMSGYEGGAALARQRRVDAASRMASQRYQAGDYTGAESAFLNEGMIAEAGAIGDLGERSRQRQGRDQIRSAMSGEGDFSTRLQRGRDAALQQGEFDLAGQLSGMGAEELQRVRETARLQAGVMMSLSEMPEDPAARRRAALQIVQQHPYLGYTAEQVQALPDEFFSNQSLTQSATGLMDIENQVNMRYQRERDQIEDSRWEREFQAQERERSFARSRRGAGGGGIAFSSASAFRGRYENDMQDLEGTRRDIETIEPFARDAAANNGRPTETDRETVRTQDGILLMTVARMAQGAGILSDQDVAMVQGTGIDASVANALGFINGEQQLSERQRYALSTILLRRSSALEGAMWQVYDEAVEFAQANGADPQQLGIRQPRVARQGTTAEQQPGEQQSQGVRMASERLRQARQRPTPAQQIPSEHREELYRNRNSTAALLSFDRRYGPGAARAVIQEMEARRASGAANIGGTPR